MKKRYDPKDWIPNMSNTFAESDTLNNSYAKRLAEVFNGGLADRYINMTKIYDDSRNDSSLSDKKKKLISDMYDSFKQACGIVPPKKLIDLLDTRTPNLDKIIRPERVERVYDDIEVIFIRLIFQMIMAKFIPLFTTSMMTSYGFTEGIERDREEYNKTGIRNSIGMHVMALLGVFSRRLFVYNHKDMWFVLMFIKNLSVNSIISPALLEQNPEYKLYAKNLFDFFIYMMDNKPATYDDGSMIIPYIPNCKYKGPFVKTEVPDSVPGMVMAGESTINDNGEKVTYVPGPEV